MSQHTPGPLTVEYGVHVAFLFRRPDVLITVDCREAFGDPAEWARLIAAAPDLLAALQRLTGRVALLTARTGREGTGENDADVRDARTAIAKATGR